MEAYPQEQSPSLMYVTLHDALSEERPFHRDPELFFVLEGTVHLCVGELEYTLNERDFMLVNAGQPYRWQDGRNLLVGIVAIDYPTLCRHLGTSRPYFLCNSTLTNSDACDDVRSLLYQILSRMDARQGLPGIYLQFLYYQLLFQLVNSFQLLPEDPRSAQLLDESSERRRELIAYIDLHSHENLKLSDLAAHLYLSEAYLSRCFKKELGCGFVQYLNRVRLAHAVEELLTGSVSVTRAAIAAGFPSVAAFNKLFRETYQMAPSDYIALHRKNHISVGENTARLNARVKNVLAAQAPAEEPRAVPVLSTAAPEELTSSITLDAASAAPRICKMSWRQVINIGTAAELLRAKVQEHVLFLHRELGFTHVRLWQGFSRELYFSAGPESQSYNFRRFDEITDFLISNGMHPFLELGSKPQQIIRTLGQYVRYQEAETLFPDPAQAAAFLQALLRHSIQRYGLAEVECWQLELWYNGKDTTQQYLDQFDLFSQAVKAEASHLSIGGAGLNLNLGREAVTSFLREWKRRMIHPDFLSLYCYQYIPYAGQEPGRSRSRELRWQRSTDRHYLRNQLLTLREILKELRFELPEVYVSEWNLTISSRDIFNDSCYKGAYLMQNLIDAADKASVISYWVGSDAFSEDADSAAILSGGSGLLTRDGIRKPAFYAFAFLNQAQRYLLWQDDHCMVTHDGQGCYHIACHNCKQFNFAYYASSEQRFENNAPQWEQVFENYTPLRLRFQLSVPAGSVYRITRQSISRRHGSVLDHWNRMGRPNDLPSDDIDYIRQVCIPEQTITLVHEHGGLLEFETLLQPNELQSLFLRPYI